MTFAGIDAVPCRRAARVAGIVLLCGVCAAISFAVGRYGRTWAASSSTDGRTHTLPRESLPTARLGYPTGAAPSVEVAPLNDSTWHAIFDRVRSACAIVGSGSGVCINARGDILTNAHVAIELGRPVYVQFPDGGRMVAKCFAVNQRLDLALVGVQSDHAFAHVPLASRPAKSNTPVMCIGNPAEQHPDGLPSSYAAFSVSIGRIVDHAPQPLGDQTLGRTQHDAWTYWGHSGAPLFNDAGHIVALHNSWEASAGTRHAVPIEAILHFLREANVPFAAEP